MWSELVAKVDEMYGASLLSAIAAYAMFSGAGGGIVEMCVTGVIALLVTKAVKSTS